MTDPRRPAPRPNNNDDEVVLVQFVGETPQSTYDAGKLLTSALTSPRTVYVTGDRTSPTVVGDEKKQTFDLFRQVTGDRTSPTVVGDEKKQTFDLFRQVTDDAVDEGIKQVYISGGLLRPTFDAKRPTSDLVGKEAPPIPRCPNGVAPQKVQYGYREPEWVCPDMCGKGVPGRIVQVQRAPRLMPSGQYDSGLSWAARCPGTTELVGTGPSGEVTVKDAITAPLQVAPLRPTLPEPLRVRPTFPEPIPQLVDVPRQFPWKWIAIGAGALVLGGVVYRMVK